MKCRRGRQRTVARERPADDGTLMERVWAWLHETFPERQIYIRSDGRVQFFTFGPSLQATLAGLALIFLGWVAFATVNVIFKDRIIAAKDHRFQQMQSAYENRLADLQISYDELNGALVGAEDKFKSTADELQTKQNAIANFLNRKAQVEAAIGSPATPRAVPMQNAPRRGQHGRRPGQRQPRRSPAPTRRNFGGDADSGSTLLGDAGPGRAPAAHRQARPCQPAGPRPSRSCARWRRRSSSPRPKSPRALSAAYAQHPGLARPGRADRARGGAGRHPKPS